MRLTIRAFGLELLDVEVSTGETAGTDDERKTPFGFGTIAERSEDTMLDTSDA